MDDPESPIRTYPCSHICRYGTALTWSDRMLFHRYRPTGKVMRARYPGPVGGGNLVSPVELYGTRSPFGIVVGHDGGRCHVVTQGPPRAGLRGRMIAGGTMGESRVRRVSLEQRWTTRMGSRGQVLHGVGKVRNLCRV
jgi:hypothetical protein